MNKKLLAALACGTLLTLSACGSSEEASNNEVKTKEKEKVAEETKKDDKKETKESAKGSRSNPVAFNEAATFEDTFYSSDSSSSDRFKAEIELSILEVIRGDEAYQILKTENQFNEPAAEGKEWALVKVKGKIVDAETEDHPYLLSDMNLDFVSSSGQVYNNEQHAVAPNELRQELFKGAEGEGYIVQAVDVGDDFKIQYELNGGKKVFFNSK